MNIVEITNSKDWKLFHKVPHVVYKNDPNWITPLESDINNVLSARSNKAFENGEARCWVILDDKGSPSGRIAAFIDHYKNKDQTFAGGGIGFFECIENKDYAFTLFKLAENYLQERGVQWYEGPVNFGERDKFWGLLVKGFDPPVYQENYHRPYYQSYFEAWGFQPFEQILTLKGGVANMPLDRYKAIAERLKKREPYSAVLIDFKKTDKFAADFCSVYNAAFAHFEHFKPLVAEQIAQVFRQMKPIADRHLVCVAYYADKPIGFVALIPDINPFLKRAKGKLNLLTLPGFFLRFKLARLFNAKGIAFGIHPDYQQKGVWPLMVDCLNNPNNLTKYTYVLLATQRSHNKKMLEPTYSLGVTIDRVHVTYRKILNPEMPFEPFPFIEV